MAPLVVIVGAGRNGSTLLSRLLDGSPNLWMHPLEVNYLCAWDDLARHGRLTGETLQNATTRPLTRLVQPLPAPALREVFDRQWGELRENIISRLADRFEPGSDPRTELEGATATAAGFLPAFLDAGRRAYAPDDSPRALAFKTVETPYVADYTRVFPDARFVHIVREPVANYASLKRTWMHQKRLSFYAAGHDILRTFLEARWLPHARAIAARLPADPERHLLVRYEDLVADPAARITHICSWLGVEPPAEPDRQTALGGRPLARGDANPSKPGVEAPERAVADMALRYGYEEVVTPRERDLIVRTTASLARGLGYELAGRNGALGLWLRWLPPDASERLNARSPLRWALAVLRRRLYVTRKLATRAS